jgi:prepilin-type N-terminal cleavage/methylation domain-containing protein
MTVRNQRAFTLIELLAVVAIIALLAGILVPAISVARKQAKKASTSALLDAITKGCEIFHTELDRYPRSNGSNPFESDDYRSGPFTSGAQWLAIELIGADQLGYVDSYDMRNDSNGDGELTTVDWLDWYSIEPSRAYQRFGPYVEPAGIVSTPETYAAINSAAAPPPASLTAGGSEWNNAKLPFFVDKFNYPVLYYAANAGVKNEAFWRTKPGVYDQSDNGQFTGSEGYGRNTNSEPGWDLTGDGEKHPMGTFGYTNATTKPEAESFAGVFYDPSIFRSTQRSDTKGRVWPYRADTFILVTPGPDGVFGTDDDIRNFEGSQ